MGSITNDPQSMQKLWLLKVRTGMILGPEHIEAVGCGPENRHNGIDEFLEG